jgi:hypothetical protein
MRQGKDFGHQRQHLYGKRSILHGKIFHQNLSETLNLQGMTVNGNSSKTRKEEKEKQWKWK